MKTTVFLAVLMLLLSGCASTAQKPTPASVRAQKALEDHLTFRGTSPTSQMGNAWGKPYQPSPTVKIEIRNGETWIVAR